MKTKLLDSEIKNIKPTPKRLQLADGGGLVLYVMPNGSKLWRYRYRYNEVAKMLSLGGYPEISLKAAHYAKTTLSRLEADVFPIIGNKPIVDITAPLVVAMVRRVVERGSMGYCQTSTRLQTLWAA